MGNLNYHVRSTSAATVEVSDNRDFPLDSLIIPQSVTYQHTTYQVVAIADSAFAYTGATEEPQLRKVVIEEGIHSIGRAAFAQCYHLEKVVLPNGLSRIEEEAFSGCEELSGLNWPEGLEKIGDYAFRTCRITEFTAPSTLKTIGDYAFYKKGLEKVKLNTEMDSIGAYAFANNIGLTDLTLPRNVKDVGEGAFTITGVSEVTIPGTWKAVPAKVFEDCPELTQLTLEEGVEQIGARAFASCQQLTSLTLPESMKKVKSEAFDLTSLRSITIKNPQTLIEKGALHVPSCNYSRLISAQSDHPEVATVDAEGRIGIHGPGAANLTVELEHPETKKRETVVCILHVGKTASQSCPIDHQN